MDKGSYREENEIDNVPRGSEAYIFLGNIHIILPPLPWLWKEQEEEEEEEEEEGGEEEWEEEGEDQGNN